MYYTSKQSYNPGNLGYGATNNVDQNNKNMKSSSNTLFQNIAIMSKKAKKVLDVCQDNDAKGMLIIYQDYNMPNQRFNIIKNGSSVYIINSQNGKYLTVGSNTQSNGAPIFQQPTVGLKGQNFRLEQIGNNEYIIYTFCGKALDCCQQSTENGTRVIQYTCDKKDHQKWIIKQ